MSLGIDLRDNGDMKNLKMASAMTRGNNVYHIHTRSNYEKFVRSAKRLAGAADT